MASPPKKQNPVGQDGMTKQQRYYLKHRVEVNAANAVRMKAKRQEKNASKLKTEDQGTKTSQGDDSPRVMKDEEVDATEDKVTQASGERMMNDKEVDATQGPGPDIKVPEDIGSDRFSSCDRCEFILRQHAPIEEFFQIKRILEDFKSHALQVTTGLQAKLAEGHVST